MSSPKMMDHKEWAALDPFHQKWNSLDGRAREAAAVLGYTQEEWDSGKVTHLVDNKNWTDLDDPQKDAATLLGFTQDKWTRVFTSIHSHPHKKHPVEGPDDAAEQQHIFPEE